MPARCTGTRGRPPGPDWPGSRHLRPIRSSWRTGVHLPPADFCRGRSRRRRQGGGRVSKGVQGQDDDLRRGGDGVDRSGHRGSRLHLAHEHHPPHLMAASAAPSTDVLRRVENGVAWITLNRPEVGNAITAEMRTQLITWLEEASGDLACLLYTSPSPRD